MASIQQAARYRDARYIIALPLAFFLYHFLHGLGLLAGLISLLFGAAPVQKVREPWPGAGRFRAYPLPGREPKAVGGAI
jgi:hypothetical protein